MKPRTTTSILVALAIFAVPESAHADIASGRTEFRHNLSVTLDMVGFPTTDFNIDEGAYSGIGSLASSASHGSLDQRAFPALAPFDEATFSQGDSEISSNRASFTTSANLHWILATNDTFSDSEAASGGGLEHSAYSIADTTVLQSFHVERQTTGAIDSPHFFMTIDSAEDTAHLTAAASGSGHAAASVTVSLVGNIKNLNDPNASWTALDASILFDKLIGNTDEWSSPAIEESRSLAMPDFTRISNAKFDLQLGVRVQTYTNASVAPEPPAWAALSIGAAAILLPRRRLQAARSS